MPIILENAPACLGISYPKEADPLHYGAQRSSVNDVVFEKTRFRTCDNFPVLVKIDGKQLRVTKGKKGWADRISQTEVDEQKFQEPALCPNGSPEWVEDGQEGGLVASQAKLEEPAAAVKKAPTATRIRMMATEAAKRRNLTLRKVLRKKARKARKLCDARVGALPRGKIWTSQ